MKRLLAGLFITLFGLFSCTHSDIWTCRYCNSSDVTITKHYGDLNVRCKKCGKSYTIPKQNV